MHHCSYINKYTHLWNDQCFEIRWSTYLISPRVKKLNKLFALSV